MEAESCKGRDDVAHDDAVALQSNEQSTCVWRRDLAHVHRGVADDHAAAHARNITSCKEHSNID